MIETSYRHCQRLARRAASSFYVSFGRLPRSKRNAMYALYAFSRCVDDLGDCDASAALRGEQLSHWRTSLARALNGQYDGLLWPAVHDAVRRFSIPPCHLYEIVEGVTWDLEPPYYTTFEELRRYCYHVASAVGLACIHVWGFHDKRALDLAETCGIAFQLTNILRDVYEDAMAGRVYLPRAELARFGCLPDELQQGVCDERFRAFARFQIARAGELFDEAAPLVHMLSADARRTFTMMFMTYRALLSEIERRDGDVFSRRVSLAWPARLSVLLAALPRPGRSRKAIMPPATPPPRPLVAAEARPSRSAESR